MRLMPLFCLALFQAHVLTARADAADSLVVEIRDVPITRAVDATVEAVRQAVLATQVSGLITEVRADAGQAVKAGQLLMRIDSREAAENTAAAQAQLIQAEADYQRSRHLLEQKFVSQAAVDRAAAEFKAARARAEGAGAGQSHAAIIAPMSGVVGQRLAEAGDLALPGKPLMTVFDPKSLRLVASIPQSLLGDLHGLGRARIEFPESGRWLDSVRVEVLPTLDTATRSATLRVYLADHVAGIAPGMFARIHLVVGQGRKLLVPPAAVVRRGEITGVYVIDDKQIARLRQVRLGESLAEGIEVLAGIKAGERIALDPLNAGQHALNKP